MENSYFTFHKSQVGYNHIKLAKGCEDVSGSYQDEKVRICVVADGHGSDNYPRADRGAAYAVQAALSCMKDFFAQAEPEEIFGENQGEMLSQLGKSILRAWYEFVEEDYTREELTVAEMEKVSDRYKKLYLDKTNLEKAYGTTLIAFGVAEDFSLGLQVGDGKCVLVDGEGIFSSPIPDDPNCQGVITTSLCDVRALEEFRYYVAKEPPLAVFCGSDGIEDSYGGMEDLFALYRSISTIFAEHGADTAVREVEEYLPILTKRGSGDDVSIAGIVDLERIGAFKEVFETQAKLYRVTGELEQKTSRIKALDEYLMKLKKIIEDGVLGKPAKDTKEYKAKVETYNARDQEYWELMEEIPKLREEKEQLEEKLRNIGDK